MTTPVVCQAVDSCHAPGVCDVATGVCTNPPASDAKPCEDGICFTDVARSLGIAWANYAADFPYYIGGGAAFVDVDQDGWVDALVIGERGQPALFRNHGGTRFEDVTVAAGILPLDSLPMGVAAGDYDNDGYPDLYLTAYGANVLYHNDRDGTFTDVTAAAGVAGSEWSVSAAFGDYDQDGYLDLYVGNYIKEMHHPNHTPWPNRLYHNNGDGTFSDVTEMYGVAGRGTTLSVTFSDFDNDGDVDLWVGNDFGQFVYPNELYRNSYAAAASPASVFTEEAAALHVDLPLFCMGITAGDFDRDLDLDYYLSNYNRNQLMRNDGATGFTNVTDETGTGIALESCFKKPLSSWGSGFYDFDNDGWLDLFVSNGDIPYDYADGAPYAPNSFFKNLGDGTHFKEISSSAGVADSRMGRGVAFADFDHDGDVDVLQVNMKGSAILWRNDSPAAHGWAEVTLVGRLSNRDAIGAHLVLKFPAFSLLREVNRTYGYASSSEPTVHFGYGDARRALELDVLWPSGVKQRVFDVASGSRTVLLEPFVTLDSAVATAAFDGKQMRVSVSVVPNNRGGSSRRVQILGSLLVGGATVIEQASTVDVPQRSADPVEMAMNVGTPTQMIDATVRLRVTDDDGAVDQLDVPVTLPPAF